MRFTLTIIAVLLTACTFSQSGIVWGPEISVSDGTTYGNLRPRATIIGNDTPVVIYGRAGDGNLYTSRWNGSSFDTPVTLLPLSLSAYIANWTGPDIASQGDTIVAVFKLNPLETGNVYSVRSVDGGLTFTDTIRVDNHDTGVAWMPSMDMDANGDPVVTYMAHDASWSNPRYVIANSSDAGVTYNPETEVTSAITGEACDCCPAEMVIEGQKQVMLFRNNDMNTRDIFGVLSTDGGATYPSTDNIDNLSWNVNSCPATGPHGIFNSDNLLMAYASAASGKYRVYVSSSTTVGALTFDNRVMMVEPDPANGTQNYPRISGIGDTVVMAWSETTSGNQNIYTSLSLSLTGADHLTNLSSSKIMANTSTIGAQTVPEIIYKNGFVHLFYQDNESGDLIYRRGTIEDVTGIESIPNEDFSVYPNPSLNGVFNLPPSTEVIGVTDALGNHVSFEIQTIDGALEIKINHSSKGMYFLSYLYGDAVQKVATLLVD
ncbi:MAG: T9SS type A sorting domain-containing protein [Crocinitomicaceae bacterium]|nr:T9SS type A sorting domain-containing protein [Crocinitomicaceae bacterium]